MVLIGSLLRDLKLLAVVGTDQPAVVNTGIQTEKKKAWPASSLAHRRKSCASLPWVKGLGELAMACPCQQCTFTQDTAHTWVSSLPPSAKLCSLQLLVIL